MEAGPSEPLRPPQWEDTREEDEIPKEDDEIPKEDDKIPEEDESETDFRAEACRKDCVTGFGVKDCVVFFFWVASAEYELRAAQVSYRECRGMASMFLS